MSPFSSSHPSHVRVQLYTFLVAGTLGSPMVLAQQEASQSFEECLLHEVLSPANDARTASEIRALCESVAATMDIQDSSPSEHSGTPLPATGPTRLLSQTLNNSYFRPYKNNYILFGSMSNMDGSEPFSGNTLDIKFELGMQFSVFPQSDESTGLSALQFGYSQRSWWDIAESSAPFKEHNYNPEIFWDFTRSQALPGATSRLRLVDLAGYEHQSNGLDGMNSRSWDRLYLQREFRVSEMLGWTVKLWDVVNLGDYNADIEDYIGRAEITTHLDINNWVNLDIKTLKGDETEKISYQVNLSLPMSHWVNSRFFVSYYEGYGEALISYNKKTKSLRAGFYFPLGF